MCGEAVLSVPQCEAEDHVITEKIEWVSHKTSHLPPAAVQFIIEFLFFFFST